jgi:hypothetical protein
MTAHIIRGAAYNAPAVIPAESVISPIIVPSVVIPAVIAVSAVVVATVVVVTPAVRVAAGRSALPFQIERVALAAAFRILDMNDGSPAIRAGISNQIHLAASVYAAEPEITGIAGYGTGALEPCPTCRLSWKRVKAAHVAVDFDVSRLIDPNFNGAFAAIAATAPDGRSSARRHLRESGRRATYNGCK